MRATTAIAAFAVVAAVACSKKEDKPEGQAPVQTRPERTPAADARPTPEPSTFGNLKELESMLVGGLMTADEVRRAADAGYRTIIDLRAKSEPGVAAEEAQAGELGLSYVGIPIAGPDDLTEENARHLDAAIAKASGPVIIHCSSGNRVGALLALRAHYVEGKSAKDALEIGRAAGMTSLEPTVKAILGD